MNALEGTEPERRTGGRSARVVRAVLEATLDELAQTGYRALSIEAVATRAGVAKTTIYRRWPTRADLVRAAFADSATARAAIPNTGALHTDLLDYYWALVKRMSSATGRSLVRMTFAEADDPELSELVHHVRAERKKIPRGLVDRAIARGEVPSTTDIGFLLDALGGMLHYRVGLLGQTVGRRELSVVVARTLAGATATPGTGP